MDRKKLCTVSVDLDGLWVIKKYLGQKYDLFNDPFFESTLPLFLDIFEKYGIKATFFVNAQDLSVPAKKKVILRIKETGHELANHGLSHCHFNNLSLAEKGRNISESTRILKEVAGGDIFGFRAPGYGIDNATLDLLEEHGYLYDASVLPTFITPVLLIAQKVLTGQKRSSFGGLGLGRVSMEHYRPAKTKIYRKGDRGIIEVPISTIPILRVPFHFSYVLLSGMGLFKIGINLIKMRGYSVNYLFHLLDLVDVEENIDLKGIFGARQRLEKKLKMFIRVVEELTNNFRIMTIEQSCRLFMENSASQIKTDAY